MLHFSGTDNNVNVHFYLRSPMGPGQRANFRLPKKDLWSSAGYTQATPSSCSLRLIPEPPMAAGSSEDLPQGTQPVSIQPRTSTSPSPDVPETSGGCYPLLHPPQFSSKFFSNSSDQKLSRKREREVSLEPSTPKPDADVSAND